MTPAQPRAAARHWRAWIAALAGLLAFGVLAGRASPDTPLSLGLLAIGLAAIVGLVLWRVPGLILPALLINIWLVAGRADPGDLLQAYPIARWLSYLIIPAFALAVVMRALARGNRWRLTGLEPWLAGLVILTILSGLVNRTGATAVILSLAIYLRYPLLLLALYNLDLGAGPYVRFARAVVWVSLALLAEGLLTWALLGRHGDGTFLTTGSLFGHVNAGLLLVYAICLVCAHALVTRWRWPHLALLGLVVVVASIASIRSTLLLLPLLPAAMWAVRQRLLGSWRLPRLALAALVGMVAWGLALGPNLVSPTEGFGLVFLAQLRLIGVRDAFDAMAPANREWLGFGPRSFSPGSLGAPGEMYQLELNRRGLYWIDNVGQSELATGFSELGVLGFAVYWLMLAGVLVVTLRFRAEYLAGQPDPRLRQTWSLLTLAFVGVWLHYALLGLAYYDVWRLDATSLVFWGLAAAILSQRRAWRLSLAQAAA